MGGGNDMSAFTYNPQMRAQAQALGVNPLSPEQVNPNAVLPNSGFFGAHPRFAQALEGGLFGAANTRGAETWGEGISNIAQGLIQGRAQRANIINRQFEAPFAQAEQMGRLKEMQSTNELHEAMIQHYRAQSEHMKAQDELGQDKLDETRPYPIPGVGYAQLNPATRQWEMHPVSQEKPEKESEWTDYRDARVAKGVSVEQAAKEYANLHTPKPPAPPTQYGGSYVDKKGVTRFYVPQSGSPLPEGFKPFKESVPVNIFQQEQPTRSAEAQRKEQEAEHKQAGSPASRKEIEGELRRQKLASVLGSKGKFDPSKIAVSPQEIDAEIARRSGQQPASSPKVRTYNPNTGKIE